MASAHSRFPAWRMGCTALAALYGYACLGSGLDRLSAINPAWQAFVPAPFRANAETGKAALALASGTGIDQSEAVRRAVLADPVDRRPIALLGTQRLLAQDYAGAEAAFRISAKLGWREPVTQGYWYRAALQAGDTARAAERVDALLRANPGMAGGDEMINPLLATPRGRQALADRLSYRPGWLPRFLAPSRQASSPALTERAEVVRLMAEHGASLSCAEIEPLERRLAEAGLRQPARTLRPRRCGAGQASGPLFDSDFADLARGGANPAGWQLHPSGDVSVSPSGTGRNAAVTVRNLASIRRPILSQRVDLEAGTYRVELAIAPGNARDLISASFDCGESRPYPDPGQPLTIVAKPCASQTLTLWLSPSMEDVRIDTVRLERRDSVGPPRTAP